MLLLDGQPYSMASAAAERAALMADPEYTKAALGGDIAKQQHLASLLLMTKGVQPGGAAMPDTPEAVCATMLERDRQIDGARLILGSVILR